MEFAFGALMLIVGLVTSPLLTILPISRLQLTLSAMMTAFGFMIVAHSLAW